MLYYLVDIYIYELYIHMYFDFIFHVLYNCTT